MNDRNWGGKREGSGRKPTGLNIVNITLTLTKEEAQILRERAEYESLTVSRFIAKHLHLKPLHKSSDLPESLTGGERASR